MQHLTSRLLFQRAMKYPEKLFEAIDASISYQSDVSLTEVAALIG